MFVLPYPPWILIICLFNYRSCLSSVFSSESSLISDYKKFNFVLKLLINYKLNF